MDRRKFLSGGAAAFGATAARAAGPKVMLMERVGPTASDLYVADADGGGERRLLARPGFDYHAAFAPNGRSVVFTSERAGRGQADLWMADLGGGGLRRLTSHPAVDDAGAVSPDGGRVAFVSTREGGRANVWTLDLHTGRTTNLTGRLPAQGDPALPDGFFRPAWSPDGRRLAFSSDRNTPWRGHPCSAQARVSCSGAGEGWEHVQALSLYVIGADGRGGRLLAAREGHALGSPSWSPDGRRVVFYEMPVAHSWYARIPMLAALAQSQIVSVDVATGERAQHTDGPGLKLFPQMLETGEIAYQLRGGADEGLRYTSGRPAVKAKLRSPRWSADGQCVVYEKTAYDPLPQNTPLYSWDAGRAYRSTDSFPSLSRDGLLVLTEQAQGSGIAVMKADGSARRRVFQPQGRDQAFAPCWSPDGRWIIFGLGRWFENRATESARLMRMRPDGSELEALTGEGANAGFPSCSPDGKRVVYRAWSAEGAAGLRILDLADRSTTDLTTGADNLPDWSPDGRRIVFTRRLDDGNFDIFTIRPDGAELRRLTTSGANDAHAVWTPDGRVLWTSGRNGFKDEAALYDASFQPYGQIWIMDADGARQRPLTDSLWEDGEPAYVG
jgi:Tol biopolymer transport system component